MLLAAFFALPDAWGDEPRRLRGRVYGRGSVVRIADANVEATADGATLSAKTNVRGEFEFVFSAAVAFKPLAVALTIKSPRHEALHAETLLKPGATLTKAEYLLKPLPAYRNPFDAVVRSDAPNEGQHTTLRGEELTTLPGSLGDPFRVIGLLPGVATPIPLLPVFVVRGASPGMNGFFLDGMRVPQLFHLLVGGGVIHARLVDQMDFYPGAYDASFGRYAGGIIEGKTRAARPDGYHGELEVRLFDLGALVELALPKEVKLTLSGHYGYPGPIVHAIDNRVNVSYWDYQLRLDWRGLTVQALGSYDEVSIDSSLLSGRTADKPVENTFRLTFHRLQLRYIAHRGRMEIETAAVGGIDEMLAFQGTGVRKYSLQLRALASWRFSWMKLRLGIDTELSRFEGQNFGDDPMRAHPDDLGELSGSRDGVVASGFAVASIGPLKNITATLSTRLDVYHAGTVTLLGVDPRFQVRAALTDWLTIHAGYGFYQQPPSFVGSSRVDLQACKLEYSIVSPK